MEFYRDEIDRIEQEHIEITRATRIRLEQDNQALEIELQKVKTNTTLNTEKLDYNFQVLKKREDENLMVRNAQKRRLTKLNETIFVLRRKIKDVQMNCLIETEKLTSDVMKLRFNISHMSTKVNTFAEVNDKKVFALYYIIHWNRKLIIRFITVSLCLADEQKRMFGCFEKHIGN